ncbi:MAG TPA: HlyC/CorC family transporter [Clostridia bacterium]|jgi:putative hemolysin|nr:HlyC/CorC family transporter [Clostridia bacterium]
MILIVLNAFFAASEIALISLNDNKIRVQAEGGDNKAELLLNLLNEPSNFLATIQVGITLAGFLASAFASESFANPLVKFLLSLGIKVSEAWLKTVAVFVITIILSYFTLVLGELVPKRLAMKKSETVARLVARPLSILSKVTLPVVKLLTISTNFFVKLFGVDPNEEEENVTEEEIRMMVDVGEEKGTIQEVEKLMINNIFEFDDTTVEEIMTHRTSIAALPIDATLDEVIELFEKTKYSRIPVYEDTIDNIVGVMHAKCLISYLAKGKDRNKFHLANFIRHPYFVPASKRADELFKELQQNKVHLAVIIDEYGGTAGIVTLEDLVEEIVGNIFDEDEEIVKEIEKMDETTFMINGSTSLDMVADYLQTRLPTDEYDTLSGFLIGQLGRIPQKEEKPTLEFNNLIFKIEKVDGKRIAKVKVCRMS